MRTELFAIEKADIFIDKKQIFHQLHMTVYRNELLGIICSDPEDKSALLTLFNRKASISQGNLRLDNYKISPREFRLRMPETVSVISSKNKLIPSLSILENITLLQSRHSSLLINVKKNQAAAKECLQKFDLSLDLDRPVKQLTSSERVTVELLQAYLHGCRAIILTDLSEFLSRSELFHIHSLLIRLKEMGLAVMILDNHTSYLLRNTDYLLIIRDGTDLGTFESEMVNERQLKKYLLKGPKTAHGLINEDSIDGDTDDNEELTEMVVMEDLCTQRLHHISCSLYKGELLKLICLDNTSGRNFLRLLSGEDPITGGIFSINGNAFHPHTIAQSVQEGIVWLPQAPYQNYLIQNLSAMDNLAPEFSMKSAKKILYPNHVASLKDFIRDFTSIPDPDLPVSNFSALSRQELAYAKLLLQIPKLVFIEYPFSESTLQMRQATLRMICNLKKKGICVVIISISAKMFAEMDGDEIYLKDGCCIDENEYYETMFKESGS